MGWFLAASPFNVELVERLIPFLIVFALGAAIGSFLNVVIYRLPAGLSVLYPPSQCPRCSQPLRSYDNVPILGWVWLRGRCRYCRQPISGRYPLIEGFTAILFVAAFWRFGITLQTPGYWVFLSWLVALALIDIDTFTLPDALTRPGLILGILFQVGLAYDPTAPVTSGSQGIIMGSLGAVLGLWLFDLITILGSAALGQAAMGGGDGKLAAMLGAWLGWRGLLLSLFLACAAGAFVGGGAMALRLIQRRQPMPFGPFLALGAGITVFWGEPLISAYLRLFFPMGLL
ncbi:MAG: prepilin peptidase [Leptolyngbyaceae cyanobacterium MO_188.B28]|nr:prepilin peptidase [Leptolyngbyaceae cyanobacterium MO_188.B28]